MWDDDDHYHDDDDDEYYFSVDPPGEGDDDDDDGKGKSKSGKGTSGKSGRSGKSHWPNGRMRTSLGVFEPLMMKNGVSSSTNHRSLSKRTMFYSESIPILSWIAYQAQRDSVLWQPPVRITKRVRTRLA